MEKKEKKRLGFTGFLVIVVLLIGTLLIISKYYSSKGLIVKEYKVETKELSKAYDGLKIISFSDIHFNKSTNKKDLDSIVNSIMDYNPDILIYNGDLFTDDVNLSKNDYKDIESVFSKFSNILYKYAVIGNHDYDDLDRYTEIMTNGGFKVLKNESELLYFNDVKPIMIVGIDSLLRGKPDYQILEEENEYYKIVLLHEPDIFKNIKNYNIDLVLAGHSHGGQIRLPFVGSIYNVEGAKTYNEAYYRINDIDLYVSSGIGTSVIPFRLFNKPSINLYRFFVE